MSGHTAVIDSPARLRAVARLAVLYGHRQAAAVIRELAIAAGARASGGRIYVPGRRADQAHGWARFTQRISFGDTELSGLADDMIRHARATGAAVVISAQLAERIRAAAHPPVDTR